MGLSRTIRDGNGAKPAGMILMEVLLFADCTGSTTNRPVDVTEEFSAKLFFALRPVSRKLGWRRGDKYELPRGRFSCVRLHVKIRALNERCSTRNIKRILREFPRRLR